MEDQLLLVVFALIIGLIWLFVLYRKTKGLNKDLNYQNDKFRDENQRLIKENSKLEADNILLESEHLKFQLHPHTLGNVVATINTLAKNLHRGAESLASSLNYILYKGNKHLVSVEDEIDFIRKYIHLNELLHSDNKAKLDDSQVDKASPYYKTNSIPHLISAYLIENAYKHGDKSHIDFLNITLKLNDYSFEMTVVNRINLEKKNDSNGGLGLRNMAKRLELLTNGKYEVKNSQNEFEYQSKLIIQFAQ